jgi:hypothetical protein
MRSDDWAWKLREAAERVRSRYEHIGRKTGAPFLAVVYPPDTELAVMKEWHMLLATLGSSFEVRTVDVLQTTMAVLDEFGAENVVQSMADPMPGSSPEAELGNMWVAAVAAEVRSKAEKRGQEKPVVVLERVGALYPVTGPRAVMQLLWDSEQRSLEGPVVVLIPGILREARVYMFMNQHEEFMYRGDIL